MKQPLNTKDIVKLNALIQDVERLKAKVKELESRPLASGSGQSQGRLQGADFPDVFKVRLTTDGGSAGDSSTQCSFTYSAYVWADTGKLSAFATAVAVLGNGGRAEAGKYNAAGYGLAIRDTDGAFKLLWTDESQDCGTGCT